MKIITMAAQCDLDLERAFRRHGILFYMTKPIAPVLVLERVTHLMRPKSATEHGLNTFPGKEGARVVRHPAVADLRSSAEVGGLVKPHA